MKWPKLLKCIFLISAAYFWYYMYFLLARSYLFRKVFYEVIIIIVPALVCLIPLVWICYKGSIKEWNRLKTIIPSPTPQLQEYIPSVIECVNITLSTNLLPFRFSRLKFRFSYGSMGRGCTASLYITWAKRLQRWGIIVNIYLYCNTL